MIFFLGDINFSDDFFDIGRGIGSRMKKGFDPLSSIRKEADILIGNFECVCSDLSVYPDYRKEQFRISPAYLKGKSHCDIYTVANNHIMQHGNEAFQDTLANLNNLGADHVGSAEKKTTSFFYKGKKICLANLSFRDEKFSQYPLYWYSPEISGVKEEIEKMPPDCYKILCVHWGNEFINHPYYDQKLIAHQLADLGFDLIVGGHPHVQQGMEVYHDCTIFYSLGNFIFDMPWEPTRYSFVATLDFEFDKAIIGWKTMYSDLKKTIPEEAVSIPKQYTMEYLSSPDIMGKRWENEQYYSDVFRCMAAYRKVNRSFFLRHIHQMDFRVVFSLVKDFVNRYIQKAS